MQRAGARPEARAELDSADLASIIQNRGQAWAHLFDGDGAIMTRGGYEASPTRAHAKERDGRRRPPHESEGAAIGAIIRSIHPIRWRDCAKRPSGAARRRRSDAPGWPGAAPQASQLTGGQ